MKIIIQRVSSASVVIQHETQAKINQGLLALIGISKLDSEEKFISAINKIINLRIFSNADDKFDYSLLDVKGEIILVPQFTLFADTSKGRRPEFFEAMPPKAAKELFVKFILEFEKSLPGKVQAGVFGADMQVELVNQGPVTICLDF